MFEIKDITNEDIAKFFLEDPALAYMGLTDDFLVGLYYNRDYAPAENSLFKGFYLGEHLVFVFKYELFTPICLNIHCYLNSRLHHSGAFGDIQGMLKGWTRENYPDIKKVIAMTPEPCKHIEAVCLKFGFKKEGHLAKAMIWRKELVDLLIFGMEI